MNLISNKSILTTPFTSYLMSQQGFAFGRKENFQLHCAEKKHSKKSDRKSSGFMDAGSMMMMMDKHLLMKY